MIPEAVGLGLGNHGRKGSLCLKGPKTTYTAIAIAEKQPKRSKKGPLSLYIGGSPPSPTRKWN